MKQQAAGERGGQTADATGGLGPTHTGRSDGRRVENAEQSGQTQLDAGDACPGADDDDGLNDG